MSDERKKRILQEAKDWITRLLIAANIFFLTEVYSDFKQLKADMSQMKQELSSMRTAVDYLRQEVFRK